MEKDMVQKLMWLIMSQDIQTFTLLTSRAQEALLDTKRVVLESSKWIKSILSKLLQLQKEDLLTPHQENKAKLNLEINNNDKAWTHHQRMELLEVVKACQGKSIDMTIPINHHHQTWAGAQVIKIDQFYSQIKDNFYSLRIFKS